MRALTNKEGKNSPEKRANSSFFYCNGLHYLIGGGNRSKEFNDVWTLDLGDGKSGFKLVWEEVKPKGIASFTPRTGQAATMLGNKVYVFGGQNYHEHKMYDDALCYDISTNEWSPLEVVKGSKPSARNSATLIADEQNNRLFLFGGADLSGNLGDFYIYDAEGKEWTSIDFKEKLTPEKREMHTALFYNGELCITPAGLPVVKEKTVDLNFSNTMLDKSEEPEKLEETKDSKELAQGKDKEKVDSRFLILMGGRTADGVSNEIWALDLKTLQWMLAGRMPQAICAQASVLVDDEVFIYGGTDGAQFLDTIYVWNIKQDKWYIYAGKAKEESLLNFRIASSMSYNSNNNTVVMFGGCSYEEEISDVQILNVKDTGFRENLQVVVPKL